MPAQPQTLSSVAPITYGYIYSHMRKHQRITTLAILNPGDDFIDGVPCDSVADAAERADGMGVMLLDISEVCEILKQRRTAPADVAAYIDADTHTQRANDAMHAPLHWNSPVQPELTVLDAPEPLEVLGAGDFVHITPHYGKRPYFAYVEAVMGDRVVVSHWSFGYVCEHGVEEVALKLKKAALETAGAV